jgi:hypothetical protein
MKLFLYKENNFHENLMLIRYALINKFSKQELNKYFSKLKIKFYS